MKVGITGLEFCLPWRLRQQVSQKVRIFFQHHTMLKLNSHERIMTVTFSSIRAGPILSVATASCMLRPWTVSQMLILGGHASNRWFILPGVDRNVNLHLTSWSRILLFGSFIVISGWELLIVSALGWWNLNEKKCNIFVYVYHVIFIKLLVRDLIFLANDLNWTLTAVIFLNTEYMLWNAVKMYFSFILVLYVWVIYQRQLDL